MPVSDGAPRCPRSADHRRDRRQPQDAIFALAGAHRTQSLNDLSLDTRSSRSGTDDLGSTRKAWPTSIWDRPMGRCWMEAPDQERRLELTSRQAQIGGVELTIALPICRGRIVKTLGWGRPRTRPRRRVRSIARARRRSCLLRRPPRRRCRPGPRARGPAPSASSRHRRAGIATLARGGRRRGRRRRRQRPAPGRRWPGLPRAACRRRAPPAAVALPRAGASWLEASPSPRRPAQGLRTVRRRGGGVGVRTISGTTALHRARTSAELLDYRCSPPWIRRRRHAR